MGCLRGLCDWPESSASSPGVRNEELGDRVFVHEGERLPGARTADGGRAVRDSNNRDGGTQFYTPTEWAAFLDGIKAGEFDD
ncbi:DUF397 domain-containing protein [Streptomyces sp. NPDC057654]|uniref:DUF397 domain-containing protein n=1 Tax=Streptomyces sp. NPDC057654 TaxID=3346196 RepID=UPI0036C646C4